MNVIQRPRAREFCGTMQDYIIDTDVSITFSVEYGGRRILEEEYAPDGKNQVRVRKLGQFCELALWGVWCAGDVSWQSDAAGTFTFFINGAQDAQSFVMFSRLQTKKDAFLPNWLTEANEKVTHENVPEYLSHLMGRGGIVNVTVYGADGGEETKALYTCIADNGGVAVTLNVGVEKIGELFTGIAVQKYKVSCNEHDFVFYVDRTMYAQMWTFRYKNVYDMPETLTAKGGLKVTGGNEAEEALMWGVDRKFSVKVTDEYAVNSGAIMLQSDYKLWHNLLNAQEAEIFVGGEWLPIVITKQKYERDFRRSVLKAVDFSFRMADAEQNNLIEV